MTDHPQGEQMGCLDTSSKFLNVNLCNIRGLRSNYQSVEPHLSFKYHFLFLTDNQVSEVTDTNKFSASSHLFYPHFKTNVGCSISVCNDITILLSCS